MSQTSYSQINGLMWLYQAFYLLNVKLNGLVTIVAFLQRVEVKGYGQAVAFLRHMEAKC